MPNNWKTYKLGEIATVQTGPFGSQLHQKDYVQNGTPILTVEHLGNNRIVHQNLPRVSDYDKMRLKKYCIQKGDIVFSRVGSVDRRAFVTEKEDGWLFSGRCLRVRADEKNVDGSFLSYYFGQESFKDLIRRIAVGATMPSLNTSILSSIEINIPANLQEQKSIAAILSTIDDKIENNLAINKTLEEMAMALYKHWFVDFGPFQDGEFVESESGRIPKGWEVKKIGEVIETLGGGTPSTTTKEYWEDGDILWYSPTDLTRENSLFSFDTAKKITALGLQKSSAKMFPANSLLMSSRATIGLLTINTKEACTNQGFITMLPNDKLSVYQLYFWVKDNMDLIISKANGSTFKEISKSNFRDLEIVVPNSIENFIEQSKDIFEQIKNNTSENQTLIQLRDTLLPKLISGEVRLKEFVSSDK